MGTSYVMICKIQDTPVYIIDCVLLLSLTSFTLDSPWIPPFRTRALLCFLLTTKTACWIWRSYSGSYTSSNPWLPAFHRLLVPEILCAFRNFTEKCKLSRTSTVAVDYHPSSKLICKRQMYALLLEIEDDVNAASLTIHFQQ